MFDMQRWRHALRSIAVKPTSDAARCARFTPEIAAAVQTDVAGGPAGEAGRQVGMLADVPPIGIRPAFDPRSSQVFRHRLHSCIESINAVKIFSCKTAHKHPVSKTVPTQTRVGQ